MSDEPKRQAPLTPSRRWIAARGVVTLSIALIAAAMVCRFRPMGWTEEVAGVTAEGWWLRAGMMSFRVDYHVAAPAYQRPSQAPESAPQPEGRMIGFSAELPF